MSDYCPLRKIRVTSLCLLVLMSSWLVGPCRAQDHATEYSVKAAFLLNFARFTEWPSKAFSTTQAPIEVCVMGNDPFGPLLDQVLENETVNGRKLLARRISAPPTPQTCQILFVDSQLRDVRRILESVGPGTLTIADGSRFIQDGGMIALVIDNRRVRFEIDQKVAEGHEIKLSSRLLSVARSVNR